MSHARVEESIERDLRRLGADELGEGGVGALDLRRGLLGRLVAAGRRLELEVADDGVEHRLGEQRRAGVVEVQHRARSRA